MASLARPEAFALGSHPALAHGGTRSKGVRAHFVAPARNPRPLKRIEVVDRSAFSVARLRLIKDLITACSAHWAGAWHSEPHAYSEARRHTMGVCFSIVVKASSSEVYGPGSTLVMRGRERSFGSMRNRCPGYEGAHFVMRPMGRPSRSVRVCSTSAMC
jgi:hypothetical protein